MSVQSNRFRSRIDNYCSTDKKGNKKLSVVKILMNTKDFISLILEILDLIEEND